MPTMYRSDQTRVQVAFFGVQLDIESWDSFDGGDQVANNLIVKPGGMQPSVDLGGVPTRSPITVKREWSDALIAVYKQLDNLVGKTFGTITVTTLDVNGLPVPGGTIGYSGVLQSVARPPYDSETTARGDLTLVMSCNGPIT